MAEPDKDLRILASPESGWTTGVTLEVSVGVA